MCNGVLNKYLDWIMYGDISVVFGVPGESENESRYVECASCFNLKYIRKYSVARCRDGIKVKSLIDLMLANKDILKHHICIM